ncbi:putative membrane protein YhhN [Gelidibacter algens]|uniref:Putative membrane protein YhhN n=1 Tax=Gelidibacter algens TaxID=49280 RepID=A0A1A7R5G6_9FLAO|nr:lysoplasmalogenase [Gelidibacter algens]OBX27101.1 hypothetical protein A9996_01620 [Gelidibacter algens]RAJ27940.1 putative membrane protein YhhN [Gelidibacter algens]
MLTKTDKLFTSIFILLITAELICGSIQSLSAWHYITKPSLLIALTVFFYSQSKGLASKTRIITVLALVFSLLGDVLLMFVDMSPHYFMLGLVSFLVAHVCYCLVFLIYRNPKINLLGVSAVFFIYALGLFYLLKDGLGDLLIPVLIYMIVILMMAITAFLRQKKVPSKSFILVFLGALLFLISDSLLALNKFYMPLRFSSISIMLTYALAQYFIVLGLLKQR